jgi:Rieske [2Fe-2S] domain
VEQDGLVLVGDYRRELGASIARMAENALDWEHLPHLHAASFGSIRLTASDASGWHAEVTTPGAGTPLELELRLSGDPATGAIRWVTTTWLGGRPVGRIETDAEATGERSCRIHVRFFSAQPGSGAFFRELYARLYDEDEAMMVARQQAIDSPDKGFRLAGVYRIPNACPHLGLPLDAEPDAGGIVTCPWHGYRFDAATGACVSGARCGWTPQPMGQPSVSA